MPGPIVTTVCVFVPLSLAYHLYKGRKVRRAERAERMQVIKRESLAALHHGQGKTLKDVLPAELPDVKPVANDVTMPVKDTSILDDTISALRNLGMTKASASKLAGQVWDQTPNDITLSDMVKRCLKALHK